MSRLLDWLDRILRGITVALVLAMLVILTIQIASRYVFGKAFSWSEELSLLGFAWVIALSTVLALRHGMHARMALLPEILPKRLQEPLERFIALLMCCLGGALMVSGWGYVSDTSGMVSAAMQYPMELLYGVAPVFGALIAVFSLERALLGQKVKS